jgi:hypothetical protein
MFDENTLRVRLNLRPAHFEAMRTAGEKRTAVQFNNEEFNFEFRNGSYVAEVPEQMATLMAESSAFMVDGFAVVAQDVSELPVRHLDKLDQRALAEQNSRFDVRMLDSFKASIEKSFGELTAFASGRYTPAPQLQLSELQVLLKDQDTIDMLASIVKEYLAFSDNPSLVKALLLNSNPELVAKVRDFIIDTEIQAVLAPRDDLRNGRVEVTMESAITVTPDVSGEVGQKIADAMVASIPATSTASTTKPKAGR